MSNGPDPNGVDGAIAAGDGYVLLPLRFDGSPGDAVAGFDAAGSVSVVVIVDGAATSVDVLVESSDDGGSTWSTLNDFSGLDHTSSPAIFHADTPAAELRATVTGAADRVEVRVFPHAGARASAVLDVNGVFGNVTKPTVLAATGAALLAALVNLGLVVDGT